MGGITKMSECTRKELVFTYAKVFELGAAIITLIIIAINTWQMNTNIIEIKKSVELDANKIAHSHKQAINKLLIDEKIDFKNNIFNLSKEEALGFLLLNDYENLFRMHANGLISDKDWPNIKKMICGIITSNEYIYRFWRDHRVAFRDDFVKFVDSETKSIAKKSNLKIASH